MEQERATADTPHVLQFRAVGRRTLLPEDFHALLKVMTLGHGEPLQLFNSKGECVISLDPDDVLPSIHLMNPAHGMSSLILQIHEGRPRIIIRRANGRDGLYMVCQGDGEMICFHNSEGRPVLRLGFDAFSEDVVVCETPNRKATGGSESEGS